GARAAGRRRFGRRSAMPRTLTLELPDLLVPVLEREAELVGLTLEQWALERLRPHAPTPAERAAGLERLMRHAGAAGPDAPADAVTFLLMTQFGETEALTTDHHFEQAGFIRLLEP